MATRKRKIYVLTAGTDARMIIEMQDVLKDVFPEYYNHLATGSLHATAFRSERFELSVYATEAPSDKVKAVIEAFRAGWRAHENEAERLTAKPDSFKSKYEALRAAIDRAAEGPGSVGTIKNFADSQDLSSFDAVSTALARE